MAFAESISQQLGGVGRGAHLDLRNAALDREPDHLEPVDEVEAMILLR